ncbi:NUDIX hydrolase [Ornithinimicrobium sp. EGI L100131]|nr:NUDIX hydrolase [Ornithinimicrobium sediminis]
MRTRSFPNLWQPPGGKIHPYDASPEEAIHRELSEELGLQISHEDLILFGSQPADLVEGTVYFFVGRLGDRLAIHPDTDELLETQWAGLKNATRMPMGTATRRFLEELQLSLSATPERIGEKNEHNS